MHSLDEIRAAHALIAPPIRRTPVLSVDGRDFGLPALEIVLGLLRRPGVFETCGANTGAVAF